MSFPRARQFEVVQVERIGDEVIALVVEGERIEYHRFVGGAFDVWQLLDGATDELAIAERVFGNAGDEGVALVRVAMQQLDQAGLIEEQTVSGRRLGRRRVAKAAMAAAIGGVALPAVVSISAPNSASADTPILRRNDTCGSQIVGLCDSIYCCCLTGSMGQCLEPTVCTDNDYFCIPG